MNTVLRGMPTQTCPADFWQKYKDKPAKKQWFLNKWCQTKRTSMNKNQPEPHILLKYIIGLNAKYKTFKASGKKHMRQYL